MIGPYTSPNRILVLPEYREISGTTRIYFQVETYPNRENSYPEDRMEEWWSIVDIVGTFFKNSFSVELAAFSTISNALSPL